MITTPTDFRESYFDKYEEHQQHITAILEAHIITLDIPVRILYRLGDSGLRTVADLLRLYHAGGLRNVRNIGVTAAAEVEKILSRADLLGLHF